MNIISALRAAEAKMEYRFKSVFEEHRDLVHVNSNDRCKVRFKIYVSWLDAAFANPWNSTINLEFRQLKFHVRHARSRIHFAVRVDPAGTVSAYKSVGVCGDAVTVCALR